MKRIELASWCPILEDARCGNVTLFYSSYNLGHNNVATTTIQT